MGKREGEEERNCAFTVQPPSVLYKQAKLHKIQQQPRDTACGCYQSGAGSGWAHVYSGIKHCGCPTWMEAPSRAMLLSPALPAAPCCCPQPGDRGKTASMEGPERGKVTRFCSYLCSEGFLHPGNSCSLVGQLFFQEVRKCTVFCWAGGVASILHPQGVCLLGTSTYKPLHFG